MNNNYLLHKAIRKNPITLSGKSNLLTDELFGIVKLTVKGSGLIFFSIYNQLNYSLIIEIQSHHESHGTFFYYNTKKQESIYTMLDFTKTENIYIKQNKLRKALQ